MGDFAALSKLKVGATEFDLVKWSRRVTPIVARDAFALRVGSELTITGECIIEAAGQAALAAAIAAAETALRVINTDVEVWDLGVKTVEITAASAIDAGPHISFQWLDQTAANCRRFSFSVVGRTTATGTSGNEHTTSTMTAFSSLGLREERKTGTIVGGTSSSEYATVLSSWLSAHPWPTWVVKSERRSSTASALEYTLSAMEMADELPYVGTTEAVEGTRSETYDTDAATGRQTVTISYDLLVSGDMAALATALVPSLAAGEVFQRETIVHGTLRERRLQCTWVILRGVDGSPLLDWQQEWKIVGEIWTGANGDEGHQNLRVVNYPRTQPIVVSDRPPEYRYEQNGRAVGCGVFIKPPYPMYPEALARPVEVTLRRLSEVERETTWRYEFVSETELVLQGNELDRPANPEQWTGGDTL